MRFPRIHLSTAVILMLVAGVIIWRNTVTRIFLNVDEVVIISCHKDMGWPLTFWRALRFLDETEVVECEPYLPLPKELRVFYNGHLATSAERDYVARFVFWNENDWNLGDGIWNYKNAAIDIALALLSLVIVGFACELIVSRKFKRSLK